MILVVVLVQQRKSLVLILVKSKDKILLESALQS